MVYFKHAECACLQRIAPAVHPTRQLTTTRQQLAQNSRASLNPFNWKMKKEVGTLLSRANLLFILQSSFEPLIVLPNIYIY